MNENNNAITGGTLGLKSSKLEIKLLDCCAYSVLACWFKATLASTLSR